MCGSPENRLFDERKFLGNFVTNSLCRKCGLVYQSPRMTEAELEDFYEEEYRLLYQGAEGPTRKDLFIQHGRAETLLHFARGKIDPPEKHLDIGCSTGALLERFRDVYGCEMTGIEPSGAYRKYARQRGHRVFASLNALSQKGAGRFDLISMAHVLEHLPDPVAFLFQLRENWLTPSGWLLIEVPNLYAHDCFEVAHLISLSPHTLRQILGHAGFQVSHLKKHGQPRSVLLPLYLTVLAKPRPHAVATQGHPIRPERAVGLKRRIGILRRTIVQRLFPDLAWLPLP